MEILLLRQPSPFMLTLATGEELMFANSSPLLVSKVSFECSRDMSRD
jgi:hypothetical protein